MFKAKVVKDSIGPNGIRLVSVETTYPRVIHSEVLTHRAFARNSASSRAIPWKKKRAKLHNETDAEYEVNVKASELLSAYVPTACTL